MNIPESADQAGSTPAYCAKTVKLDQRTLLCTWKCRIIEHKIRQLRIRHSHILHKIVMQSGNSPSNIVSLIIACRDTTPWCMPLSLNVYTFLPWRRGKLYRMSQPSPHVNPLRKRIHKYGFWRVMVL